MPIAQLLEAHIDTITAEFRALEAYMVSEETESKQGDPCRFRSITEMNYDSGWSTLVTHYNSQRIPGFPYHLCPTTLAILETVPIAGRICGFNRQRPLSGIPVSLWPSNLTLCDRRVVLISVEC